MLSVIEYLKIDNTDKNISRENIRQCFIFSVVIRICSRSSYLLSFRWHPHKINSLLFEPPCRCHWWRQERRPASCHSVRWRLKDKRVDHRNCKVLYWVPQQLYCSHKHTHVTVDLGLDFCFFLSWPIWFVCFLGVVFSLFFSVVTFAAASASEALGVCVCVCLSAATAGRLARPHVSDCRRVALETVVTCKIKH